MIVTCTTCATRYRIDPRTLGASGRTVRCAKCGQTWHVPLPEEAPRQVEPERYQPEQETPEQDAPEQDEPVGFKPLALDANEESEAEPVLRGERRGQLANLTAGRTVPFAALPWAAAVVSVLVLAVGLIVARNGVVARWPMAAELYAAIGFPVLPPGAGLDIRNVKDNWAVQNGQQMIVVEGEVVNPSTVARQVPKLEVALLDNNKHEVQRWTYAVSANRLLPGAAVPFRTSMVKVSDATASIIVTFAANDD